MSTPPIPPIERAIARCRLILSGAALIAIYVDPTRSILVPQRWHQNGPFAIDPYTLAVMIAHFGYSVAAYDALVRRRMPAERLAGWSTWADVSFGTVIAFFTEGISSPFDAFFAFAVVQTGLRSGLRRTLLVTAVSVGLYLSLIIVSNPEDANFYMMRAVYLAITGYLVGYLGQQRLRLDSEIHALAAADQRNRIARDLHDGWAQALAGINLRIASCRELLQRGRASDALAGLSELQASVHHEFDELRTYMRSLAGLPPTENNPHAQWPTRFCVAVDVSGSGLFVDHVLQILREGISNVLRHAGARSATLRVDARDGDVSVTIDDDGVGFKGEEQQPWSIASRVRELGGELRIRNGGAGAHLAMRLPHG
ncbi:MAG TPA: histidine kinase [Candidatus Binatia bacterium]|nr:histidine kinase [Candidatus Binatia bacterium]